MKRIPHSILAQFAGFSRIGGAFAMIPLFMLFCALPAFGDVLMGTNGERFVGRVVDEDNDRVIFQSELGGKITIPRASIREIQRSPAAEPPGGAPAVNQPAPVTNAPVAANPAPAKEMRQLPGLGTAKSDWVQLKSGEWLKGELKYIQQKQVEFDSDELDEQTFKLKNVRQVYPAHPMWVKFDERDPLFGTVIISNGLVSVIGPEQVSLPLDQLRGITQAGHQGMREWSGKLTLGFSRQSGNHDLTTLTTSGELARRTPNTRLLLEYLGNYSQVNSVENANNQRVNLTYEIRLDRHWFVRPIAWEYYHDPMANIAWRGTVGFGGGYYIFDRDGLEWNVGAGPSFQYTSYDTVEPGTRDTTTTPAAQLYSMFKMDITRRLDVSVSYRGVFTTAEAGKYMHHTVSTLSFEIKRHLDLDVSLVWDYLENPKQESNGDIPSKSDYYMTVGLGIRF